MAPFSLSPISFRTTKALRPNHNKEAFTRTNLVKCDRVLGGVMTLLVLPGHPLVKIILGESRGLEVFLVHLHTHQRLTVGAFPNAPLRPTLAQGRQVERPRYRVPPSRRGGRLGPADGASPRLSASAGVVVLRGALEEVQGLLEHQAEIREVQLSVKKKPSP